MVATTDLNFDLDNLHPHYKWEIGKRLAICALANNYGFKNLMPMGPLYDKMKVEGNEIVIEFKYTGAGLVNKDGKPLKDFMMEGADGKWLPAIATIKNNEVKVSAENVQHPIAVRFGWDEADHPNLYNSQGLPAIPFRTNNPIANKFK